jgi:hypothetical protein
VGEGGGALCGDGFPQPDWHLCRDFLMCTCGWLVLTATSDPLTSLAHAVLIIGVVVGGACLIGIVAGIVIVTRASKHAGGKHPMKSVVGAPSLCTRLTRDPLPLVLPPPPTPLSIVRRPFSLAHTL